VSLIKKIGIVILAVIVLLAVGSVIYSRLRKPTEQPENGEVVDQQAPAEPAVEPFISGSFSDLVASADGTTLGYLDTANFTFVRYNIATATPTNSTVTAVPDQVVWNTDLSRVIIKTTNLSSARTENPDFVSDREEGAAVYRVADLGSGDKQLLPNGIVAANWLGAEILATRTEQEATQFVSFDTSSLQEKPLVTVPEKTLQWLPSPSGATIVAWTRAEQPAIYLIDVTSKKVSQVKGSGTIKDMTISPDGSTALFTAKSGIEQRLFKIDLKSRKITKAPVNLDLSLSAWIDSTRLAVLKGDAIVEYQPSDDVLSEPGTPVSTSGTVRQLIAADNQLYFLTDSGVFKPGF